MSNGDSRLSSAELLARRFLWNRPATERPPRQPPVIVLLGPAGSGKSYSLDAISADCANGVVHAQYDFAPQEDRLEPATTIEVLTEVAQRLARGWKNRRSVRFTRFTLGLIAVQTQLNGIDRNQNREKLRTATREWARLPKVDEASDNISALVTDVASNALPAPLLPILKVALPALVKTIAHRPFGKAQRWHADIPEAEGASPEDALVSLNQHARTDRARMTSWMVQAFLADIRESHPLMAATEPGSPCACDDKRAHYHNWLLLLDNLDQPGGQTFIDDLTEARRRHLDRYQGDHDALVIIATSGRWDSAWESVWRQPWRSAPDLPDGRTTVPRCRTATYQHWVDHRDQYDSPGTYYPVLLEPLPQFETARLLRISSTDIRCELTQRATGGLPSAVMTMTTLLADARLTPGARNALDPSPHAQDPANVWRTRLEKSQLDKKLRDTTIPELLRTAAFATAPWLVPADGVNAVLRLRVGRILTELRTTLWVMAPSSEATTNYAELHPWIAQTLISALVASSDNPDWPSYEKQFGQLLGDYVRDTQTETDDELLLRIAYCQLALGKVTVVIDHVTEMFGQRPYQMWIDQLRLITRAPCDRPFREKSDDLFKELVNDDVTNRPERTETRNVIARLLIALWLARNPFAVPDRQHWDLISEEYRRLGGLASGPDVAGLNNAATNALHGIL